MSRWLYIFAGFPGKTTATDHSLVLDAGGLVHCIERVENLGHLEADSSIQLRKEGVFRVGPDQQGEWLEDFELVMSPLLFQDGITFDWFPENWSFGSRVTVHKTVAGPTLKTVIHETDLSEDEYLERHGATPVSQLVKERKLMHTEGWDKYEARWLPGTCPQRNHVVQLTYAIFDHKLPAFAHDRLTNIIEGDGRLLHPDAYERRNFSTNRIYDGHSYKD